MTNILNRRQLLGALAALAPLSALPAFAARHYTPGLVAAELAAGKTVFLDFTASWCSTCARQARVINSLKAQNSAYEEAMTFIDVDWDEYGRSAFAKSLKVPRRSTLIALKGDLEIGRIIAGTGEAEIKALMDAALAA
jgi:thiol-disulfide isomerase/thioredoxin